MKRIITAALIAAGGVMLFAACCSAQGNEDAANVQAGRQEADQAVKEIMKKQAIEKARAALNSHEWTVYLTPAPDPSGKKVKVTVTTDVLTFSGESKVASKELVAKGYPESNYTLSMQDDGTAVWETMQVNEQEGLAFFRGELRGESMKGVLSMQPTKGAKSTYYFSTTMPEIAAEQQAAPEPEAPKKKKKR